jgi:hypothetical protein
MTSAATISDIDPFSDTVLADPFPAHEALRDAGPVVRLSRYIEDAFLQCCARTRARL